MNSTNSSLELLNKEVIKPHLCCGCGACINLCPYLAYKEDRAVVLYNCTYSSGRCHAFCPQVETDRTSLLKSLYPGEGLVEDLGPFKGLYLTRASKPGARHKAQHGGTVTALVSAALEKGLIQGAILTGKVKKHSSICGLAKTADEVLSYAGSKFVVAPVVGAFNEIAPDFDGDLGVVALPCQARALAKMRQASSSDTDPIRKLKLVIGLFCGWVFSWRRFVDYLEPKVDLGAVIKMDIPPSQYQCLQVFTQNDTLELPLSEVTDCVRENCGQCEDFTAAFSDISVGSARMPQGWETAKKWNQSIVRTDTGQELFAMAQSAGFIEAQEAPTANLERLKSVSGKKGPDKSKSKVDK